ncbi:MAG: hypothetical protein ACI83O_000767 [Patescibacteria group bacterium]|jgi:hypothetical protein
MSMVITDMFHKRFFLLFSLVIVGVFLFVFVNAQCSGYSQGDVCYVIGDEVLDNGNYYYVSISGDLVAQKITGAVCNNDFECVDNLCSNGECVNLYEEVTDNKELIGESVIAVGDIDIDDTPNCLPLFDNYNVRGQNRANIIFVGFGYKDLNVPEGEAVKFLGDVLIDKEGVWNYYEEYRSEFDKNKKGFFSVEPFASYGEGAFNFWYVDSTGDLDNCERRGTSPNNQIICEDRLSSVCEVPNKYIVKLIDEFFRSSSDLGVGGNMRLSAPLKDMYTCDSITPFCENVNVETDPSSGGSATCVNSNDIGYIGRLTDGRIYAQSDLNGDGLMTDDDLYIGYLCEMFSYGCEGSRGCQESLMIGQRESDFETDAPSLQLFLYRRSMSYLQGAFMHEFGHLFGELRDEYIFTITDPLRYTNLADRTVKNCDYRSSKELCEQEASWSSLIGDDCGTEGVVDCPGDSFEVDCHEGCGYRYNAFRSTSKNIMVQHNINEYYRYGKWSEYLLLEEINKYGI